MMMVDTPPISRSSSTGLKRQSPKLSIDLSGLPPLIQPAPPSNTLIITNLTDPRIFTKPSLAHFHALITTHCAAPEDIHSLSPLRSLSRIILTTRTVDAAVAVRAALDGGPLFGSRMRVYFGEPTRIAELEERQLRVPKADKQFFISPPPSPPFGWTSREEGPPNRDVHATDLAEALERLGRRADAEVQQPGGGAGDVEETLGDGAAPFSSSARRQRTGSGAFVVFDPAESGHSPDLPAIAVEDTTCSPGSLTPDAGADGRRIIAHTTRPPVELMQDA